MKAVLFDLDGVIVDSEAISSEASEKVLRDFGIVQTDDEKKAVFGKRTIDNYRAAIKARGLDIDPQELVKRKNALFKRMIRGGLSPLPGVKRLLGELSEAKVAMAVVSSSPLERVNASLEEVGLLLNFELIVSGDCCRLGKPDPEPFLLAAQKLSIKPEDCIVIEDAQAGIEAAKAAGMKVLAVKSPNTHGQDLSGADKVVESLKEVDLSFFEGL